MAKPLRRGQLESPPDSSGGDEETENLESDDDNDDLSSYIPSYLGRMVVPYHGDFCISAIFHPQLIVQLMAEGFLPMAVKTAASPRDSASGVGCLLLPKLHAKRSVITLNPESTLHVSRSVRKKAKQYSLTLNTAWDQVVEYCQEQHSHSCWLYPPLVEAYSAIQRQPTHATVSNQQQLPPQSSATTSNNRSNQQPQRPLVEQSNKVMVRMYSVELWDNRTNELVAGELGYTVGDFMYTSLTGFSRQDSAGSVQLAAWGLYLQQKKIAIWDLGMYMAYKQQLGAQQWPRRDFVDFVRRHRSVTTTTTASSSSASASSNPLFDLLQQPVGCQQIIQAEATKSKSEETSISSNSNGKKKSSQPPNSTASESSVNGDMNGSQTSSPNSKKRTRSSSKSTNGDGSTGNT